jgi:hypothetical protein
MTLFNLTQICYRLWRSLIVIPRRAYNNRLGDGPAGPPDVMIRTTLKVNRMAPKQP